MRGIAYGVGVGPGDPELMTLKAVRLIRENEVIALPGENPTETTAFKIAAGAVPEITEKELLAVRMPMVKDFESLGPEHKAAAQKIEQILDQGRNVVYLTLGDPTLYCSFSYLQHILEADGYDVSLVSGISSVHAAAARLGIPLTEWNEPLHVYPAVHGPEIGGDTEGTIVLMKTGSRLSEVRSRLPAAGYDLKMVENCGMENEKCYYSAKEMPEKSGYFSIVIAKK